MSQIPRVQIRQPATANLMVDSADRSSGTWGNFTINRTNSILNGFFHRIGATEVVLEWNEPNIVNRVVNGVQQAQVSVVVAGTTYSVTLGQGFYNVSEAFASLVLALTAANIPGATWTFVQEAGSPALWSLNAGVNYDVLNTPLAVRMNIYSPGQDGQPGRIVTAPDLRPYRYIDIVSPSLTYNQKLKDASTAPLVRDVLVRWYFAWDEAPTFDTDGFPILMGYTAFSARRIYSPPKQIRWENNMPVGQIKFEVYSNDGTLITSDDDNQFLMTLQSCED
jgi:hypothetical protein